MNNSCKNGSHNIYKNYMPLMDDGRQFTSYFNTNVLIKNNLNNPQISNNDYRRYLMNNADALMQQNQKNACDECGYCPYDQRLPCKPYIFSSCSDKKVPFGYESSDLKNSYLQKTEINSRKIAPIVSYNGTILEKN